MGKKFSLFFLLIQFFFKKMGHYLQLVKCSICQLLMTKLLLKKTITILFSSTYSQLSAFQLGGADPPNQCLWGGANGTALTAVCVRNYIFIALILKKNIKLVTILCTSQP